MIWIGSKHSIKNTKNQSTHGALGFARFDHVELFGAPVAVDLLGVTVKSLYRRQERLVQRRMWLIAVVGGARRGQLAAVAYAPKVVVI